MGILFTEVATFTAQIRHHELFNFMLSNREILFAHASTLLYYIIRIIRPPFRRSAPYRQRRNCRFRRGDYAHDCVTIIVTQPLTANEPWTRMPR